jgi:hypothetical protein
MRLARTSSLSVAFFTSALLAGCPSSSTQPGPGPTPTPGTQEKVKPLADPPPPNEAIIFGTSSGGESTRITLSDKETSVVVDSMWVRLSSPATGGSSPVTLKTNLNPDKTPEVAFIEDTSGGLGPQWRAGVWLSAFVASTTLNKDLTDFTFSAKAAGNVDGASASGLMTAGYLAAITGVKIDEKATMTGIINPDGTIGPVGGIPQKFEGSIAKGKTRLGYPVGLQYALDVNTYENVDLKKLAKASGAEAVEIADVYDAYQLMTGQKLPRPIPVDEREMELEDEVIQAFEDKYAAWLTAVQQEWDQIINLDAEGRLPAGLINIAVAARDEAETAEKLKKQGMIPSAYKHIVQSWVYAASATTIADIVESVKNGDIPGAQQKLANIEALTNTTETIVREIGEMRPDTMGGHLQMLSAYDRAIAGLAAYMQSGEQMYNTKSYLEALSYMTPEELAGFDVAEQTVQAVTPTVLLIARAVAHTVGAKETMEIEGVKSLNYMCSLPNVKRLATSFEKAATANVTYFETLVGVKDDQTRMYVINLEPDYLTAWISSNMTNLNGFPQTLKEEWGEDSLSWRLMTLSAAELGYFKASVLISKYYSLSVQNNWYTGRAEKVEHEKAFINMLSVAEKKARENAQGAKISAGSIPVQARIAYQQARVLREGDLADKLLALEAFWQSSAYSQTAIMLARN